MSTQRKVVMITRTSDLSGMLKVLRAQLESRGVAVMRFDTDRFPLSAQAHFGQTAEGESIRLCNGEQDFRLGPDDAIWYRRAEWASSLPKTMDPQLRSGAIGESKATLLGLIAAAPCPVIDPPDLVHQRNHKPWQQRLARQCGMATPRTLITNDPVEARAFVDSCPHGAIAKMLAAFPIYDAQGEEQVVFTTKLEPAHLEGLDGLRYCPMVFQEQLHKALELRITVIGNQLFAASIDSQATEGAQTDWRARGVTLLERWQPYALPRELERAIHQYMDAIGLQYSAIDVIVEPSGRHVFLEANPAGECYWMQHNSPRYPLAEALADVLLDVPGARRKPGQSQARRELAA